MKEVVAAIRELVQVEVEAMMDAEKRWRPV
jgi:hypothetical protein